MIAALAVAAWTLVRRGVVLTLLAASATGLVVVGGSIMLFTVLKIRSSEDEALPGSGFSRWGCYAHGQGHGGQERAYRQLPAPTLRADHHRCLARGG
jgi:hypothetical protein